jgi:hypothetical protein
MLINLFFSLSILVSQLSTADNIEFTIFNKTVLIQDSVEHLVRERIDDDGMIETTVYSDDIRKEMGTISFSDAFREARKIKGAGKTFQWNGKYYTTDFYYETIIAVGEEVTKIDKENNTYYTDERLSDLLAIRSYKDNKDINIKFSFLDSVQDK